jgi:hypothetical protein
MLKKELTMKTNYINKLQDEARYLKHNIMDANDAITDLMVYLSSSKFDNDSTVQVKDILNRLQPIKDALFQDKIDHTSES